ncbi:hypothetical protein BX070DRAFT_150734 [Coemansia spiralis]|nr:hypothetical protein BX070DRAFT_150734 [Coemansia spiralis]
MPQFYSLGILPTVMVCSVWAGRGLMAIASSYLGNAALAAQSTIISTYSLTYQSVSGLYAAITNRIGNLLKQARVRCSKILSATGLCLGAVLELILLALYVIAVG